MAPLLPAIAHLASTPAAREPLRVQVAGQAHIAATRQQH